MHTISIEMVDLLVDVGPWLLQRERWYGAPIVVICPIELSSRSCSVRSVIIGIGQMDKSAGCGMSCVLVVCAVVSEDLLRRALLQQEMLGRGLGALGRSTFAEATGGATGERIPTPGRHPHVPKFRAATVWGSHGRFVSAYQTPVRRRRSVKFVNVKSATSRSNAWIVPAVAERRYNQRSWLRGEILCCIDRQQH